MKMQSILSAGLGALALAVLASTAQATPAGGLAAAIDPSAASAVEQVTWKYRRHCYWHHGHRHCWWGHRSHKWHRYHYGHRYYHRYWCEGPAARVIAWAAGLYRAGSHRALQDRQDQHPGMSVDAR
ncbi:MAG: hypothetical protein ABW200_07405, partial [Hyphomicrobiaceae bacterium]